MTRRIMPDHGKYRRTAPLWALLLPLLLAALVPADAQAQRRPRLLGRPVAQTADTVPLAGGTIAPAEEPEALPLPDRQALAMELTQGVEQLLSVHALCFSLQVMHTRVQGMALRRAGAIGSPQSRQMP